ncbi:hypothetical protein M0804_014274 [Polistes exclamans]|nr:hypothetical protein M0804_014275 [Polistes exclamans]KAI4475496.1 hypothetical protein M0804_014274 [Polistes exclamans]
MPMQCNAMAMAMQCRDFESTRREANRQKSPFTNCSASLIRQRGSGGSMVGIATATSTSTAATATAAATAVLLIFAFRVKKRLPFGPPSPPPPLPPSHPKALRTRALKLIA